MAPNYFFESVTEVDNDYYRGTRGRSSGIRPIFKKACWALLAFFGVIQIILIVELVQGLAASTIYDMESLDFALYKNSRFESCYPQPNPDFDCSIVIANYTTLDQAVVEEWMPSEKTTVNTNWCSMVGCLSGYKVIPSTPRPSAYGFTGLAIWFWLNFAVLTGIYAFMKFTMEDVHDDGDPNCGGIKSYDWLFFAIDIGTCGLWWWGVSRIMGNATNAPPVSLFHWFTAWRYTRAVQYHPIACKLRSKRSLRFKVMAFLVAYFFLEMIVTFAMAGVKSGDIDFGIRSSTTQKYNPVEPWFAQAPGTMTPESVNTTCNVTNISTGRAFHWLYVNRPFYFDSGIASELNDMGLFVTSFFILLSIACFLITCWMFVAESKKAGNREARICGNSPVDGSMSTVFVFLLILGVGNAIGLFEAMAQSGQAPNREALVMFDHGCRVVHVALSEWVSYLDIDVDRTLRVVRWIFNT